MQKNIKHSGTNRLGVAEFEQLLFLHLIKYGSVKMPFLPQRFLSEMELISSAPFCFMHIKRFSEQKLITYYTVLQISLKGLSSF